MSPAAYLPGEQGGRAPDPSRRSQPPSILVVDDEAGLREVLAKALRSSGYTTDSADDGSEAWHKLRAASYSLLITDNSMPKMTGLELVRKMRSANMDLPVILATSNPPGNLEPLRLAAVLLKPFSLETLRRTVVDAFHFRTPAGAALPLKHLARRLLADGTGAGPVPGPVDATAFGVFEKLRGPLAKVTGAGGYHALLTRAQALAGEEVLWLRALRISPDGSLAEPDGTRVERDARTENDGEVVLLAHLLGLLDTLIGTALTRRLLREIWPGLEDLDH